ncbi:B12-binding domain-containing radical SAM protein [Labrys neptuniae]
MLGLASAGVGRTGIQPGGLVRQVDIWLIKATRYDDDGYPIRWIRSAIPSNSLACVWALVEDAISRQVFGPDVETRVHAIDETNTRVDIPAILTSHQAEGARAIVMLVGVQTNQYPRAMDIARSLRAAGVPVCLGGFHVSGCVAMLGEEAEELALARELGVSQFAGEAEPDRLDAVLRDALAGTLKPLYNFLKDQPGLQNVPVPLLPGPIVRRSFTRWSSFDLGRGCPFECSFCTIINVQGRKSRFRTADELESIIRLNAAQGVSKFFVTDDNFARNRNWEAYCDRLIELREREGLEARLLIQVDTMAHRIPGFIDKVVRAGVRLIFIGLENINPDNLEAAKKRQNRIEEYREMVLAWKRHPVVVSCGYIIGFPADTRESILRDVDLIKRELAIDVLYFNILTPLPGSEDHKRMKEAGVWMDPDFNKYDLNHRVTHHPKMSDAELDAVFHEASRRYYDFEHMERVFKRRVQLKNGMRLTTLYNLIAYREGPQREGVAFAEFGLGRIIDRRERRHGLPAENPLRFYARYAWRFARTMGAYAYTYGRLRLSVAKAWRAWGRQDEFPYVDEAIAAVDERLDPLVQETADRSTPYAKRRQESRLKSRLQEGLQPGSGLSGEAAGP